jgi:hypothetical protein
MTNTDKYLVLLGLDDDKKPRAARFKYENEAGVRKLAAIKGLQIGHAKTDEAIECVLKLTDGKLFVSGTGLVPLVKGDTFERLQTLLEIEEPVATSEKAAPAQSDRSGDPWSKIAVGSAVLCPNDEKGKDRSWWECTVMAIANDSFTVKWTHYPTLKPFKVKKRGLVALLPPKN